MKNLNYKQKYEILLCKLENIEFIYWTNDVSNLFKFNDIKLIRSLNIFFISVIVEVLKRLKSNEIKFSQPENLYCRLAPEKPKVLNDIFVIFESF